ncbi:MAG: diguanylate cyclase [Candidatus Eremiobacterota bacterium]
MRQLDAVLARLSRGTVLLLGATLILLLAILDYHTEHEISLWIFYLIPISLVTWYAGRDPGLFAAFFSGLAWYFADELAGHPRSYLAIPMWNAVVQIIGFWLYARILARWKDQLLEARRLARSDHLTGATNARVLLDQCAHELERVRRYGHPMTLACMDLDNFRQVNDQFGHATGDQLLRGVAEALRGNLRTIDVVARWGGDEFVLLLPETGPEQAQMVVPRVREKVLEVMRRNQWPVTVSVGVVTFFACPTRPAPVDEALRQALDLSSAAKTRSPGSICYDVHGETVGVR